MATTSSPSAYGEGYRQGADGFLRREGVLAFLPATGVLYRSAITAADLLAAVGTVTCTKLTGVGSATAGTYTIFVVPYTDNGRGTATQGNTTVTTETTNLGIRAAFAAVAGATGYEIYCSTDGAAAKSVGRITEAQRASGIILSGVNTPTAGGAAGAVDIYVPGTGLAVNAGQNATNFGYVMPAATPIACAGYQFLDLDLAFSRTYDAAAPALTLVPFVQNDLDSAWYQQGAPIVKQFGGATGLYDSGRETFRLEVRGRTAVHVLVYSIAGTGAALDIRAVLS